MKGLHDRRLGWVVGGVALVAALTATLLPLHDWSEALEHSIDHHMIVVSLAIFCAASVVGSLLMVPAWIFPVAAGAAFGFAWGLVAAVISSALSAMAAYCIARFALRERIERAARKQEAFKAVDAAVKREPVKVVALLRMSPVLPSGLKSYLLGLTCIEPIPYLLASVLGMLPGNAIKVWLGHAGHAVLDGDGPMRWISLALGIGATLAFALVVGHMARKRIGI